VIAEDAATHSHDMYIYRENENGDSGSINPTKTTRFPQFHLYLKLAVKLAVRHAAACYNKQPLI